MHAANLGRKGIFHHPHASLYLAETFSSASHEGTTAASADDTYQAISQDKSSGPNSYIEFPLHPHI